MNTSIACSNDADRRFGPRIHGCRDNFDFTILFEQSVLSLGPSALLLIFSLGRALQLYQCKVKTVPTILRFSKLIAFICAAGLRLALLILWATQPARQSQASVAAAALSFIAILALLALSDLEHARSVRPSSVIIIYLFFSTLLDLAQARTLWLLSPDKRLPVVFTTCIAFNAVIVVLESVEKRAFLRVPFCNYPPETLGGVFNRSVFWWLNSLFLNGYRRILNFGDLYETDEELHAKKLQQRIRFTWKETSKENKHCLLLTTISFSKLSLAEMVLPRLCTSGLKLCQPLLINRATALISEPRTSSNRNISYGLIGAAALIYLGQAICNARYKHKMYRSMTMIRGGLISLISDVTLLLDVNSIKESAAVTLMSTDVDSIMTGLEYSDFIWASPIEVTVAIFLLNREIGLSCLVPLGISLGSAIAGYLIGNAATGYKKNWVDAIQKRVGVTASMLNSMKAVKMMGFTEQLSFRIQELKRYELEQSIKYRRVNTLRNAISNFSLLMAPAFTFAVYSAAYRHDSGHPFNPATAFTSLSIIILLSQSVQWWVIAMFTFQASFGCYNRVQKYLLSPTRRDVRVLECSSTSKPETGREELEHDTNPTNEANNEARFELKLSVEDVLRIENGSFGPSKDKPLVLHNIEFRIRPSTLTMVVGPVGSGKSVLLRALLGEVSQSGGTVYAPIRSIAYCNQEPWLPNVTIKQAVIGMRDFEAPWYTTVIHACALNVDIQSFANGDSSLIGSKGISLSGGQKQRLTLARAIYSRKRILLLDDVLSGLDGRTEQAVFHRVLGVEGLCRRFGTTVLLTTHAIKYLQYADFIIVLDENGRIAEQGTTEQVKSNNSIFVAMEASEERETERTASAGSKIELPARSPIPSGMQTEQASNSRLNGDLRIYVYYAQAVGWILAFYFCAQAITTFFIKFPDIWLKLWSGAEASDERSHTKFFLGIYCMFAALALCSMVIGILILGTGVMPRSSAQLHKRLLRAVITARYSFLSATDSGIILNRFSQDMSLIDVQLPTAILQTTDGVMTCIAQAILIATSSKYVAALIPAVILVLYLLQRFYLRTSRQIRLLDLETKSPLYSHFLEMLSGLTTLRAFNWQSEWSQRSRELIDRSQRPIYLLYCIQRWLGLVLDITVAACAILVIALATQLSDNVGSSGGNLGVALVNLLSLSNMLSYLVRAWTEMETSIGSVLRIRDFESTIPSEIVPDESWEPPDGDWPQYGAIEFRDVYAAYDAQSSNSDRSSLEPILKDVTLSIPSGSRVGICGRTGSGKSSLLLTLFHLTEIISGSLIIDGVEIRTLNRNSLRNRLIAVPQSPELFPGTWRLNLDPNSQFADATIIAALELVGLWTRLEPRGGLAANADQNALSHGERQLFTLAGALLLRKALRQSKDVGGVVVLDEVSASVDVDTELRIVEIVREEFAGWTVLSVAHRLETIRKCDLLVVMDGGRIAEFGSPGDLERIPGGRWKEMLRDANLKSLLQRVDGTKDTQENQIEVER